MKVTRRQFTSACALSSAAYSQALRAASPAARFPKGFLWGAATAAQRFGAHEE